MSTFPQWKPINPQEEVTEKLTEPHCKQRHRDSPSCGLQITIFPSLNCRPLTTERAPQSSLPRMRMNCTRFRLMFTLHQTKWSIPGNSMLLSMPIMLTPTPRASLSPGKPSAENYWDCVCEDALDGWESGDLGWLVVLLFIKLVNSSKSPKLTETQFLCL